MKQTHTSNGREEFLEIEAEILRQVNSRRVSE